MSKTIRANGATFTMSDETFALVAEGAALAEGARRRKVRRAQDERRRALRDAFRGGRVLPAALNPPAAPGRNGWRNRNRAEMFARAEYYAWSARRSPSLLGNDPITGRPNTTRSGGAANVLSAQLGFIADRALAIGCYRMARGYPNPLEGI